jgi:hypothetical protein
MRWADGGRRLLFRRARARVRVPAPRRQRIVGGWPQADSTAQRHPRRRSSHGGRGCSFARKRAPTGPHASPTRAVNRAPYPALPRERGRETSRRVHLVRWSTPTESRRRLHRAVGGLSEPIRRLVPQAQQAAAQGLELLFGYRPIHATRRSVNIPFSQAARIKPCCVRQDAASSSNPEPKIHA